MCGRVFSCDFDHRHNVWRILRHRGLTFFVVKAATFTPKSCRYKSSVTDRPVNDGRLLPRSVRSAGGSSGGGRAGAWPANEEGVVLPWSEVGATGWLASVSGQESIERGLYDTEYVPHVWLAFR